MREAFRPLAFGAVKTKPDTVGRAFRSARDVLTASGALRVRPIGG